MSLDWNQNSIKNANIADCLKKHLEAHKTKQINCWIIWRESARKFIDGLERLANGFLSKYYSMTVTNVPNIGDFELRLLNKPE